jgi:hypothetical protein
LEDADHVTVESNSYHFSADSEEEFDLGVTFDVTVADAGESGDDPVNSSDVIAFVI